MPPALGQAGGRGPGIAGARHANAPPAAPVLPQGASTDWWATVQENIRQSEYQITWQDQTYLADVPASYQAPNRAHNLRTYFTPTGIRWRVRLRYHPATTPFQQFSRWLTMPWNGWNEQDLRTACFRADFNCDCVVNIADLTDATACWRCRRRGSVLRPAV